MYGTGFIVVSRHHSRLVFHAINGVFGVCFEVTIHLFDQFLCGIGPV
ncbi:hypothetical protein ACFLVQ_01195 [Chloroflexota bacterium]